MTMTRGKEDADNGNVGGEVAAEAESMALVEDGVCDAGLQVEEEFANLRALQR